MALKMVPCVNCNLSTRADQKMCQHYHPKFGHHVWETKAKELKSSVAERITEPAMHRTPTQLDLFQYNQWLADQQADRAHIQ